MFDLNGAMERFAGKLALENILAAVITLLVCMVAVRLLLKLARRLLRRTKLEERIRRYILMALKLLLYTLTVVFTAGSLGADFVTVSAHKIGGPKGCGALYIGPRVRNPRPLLAGGGQESGLRAGTEATAQIAGFARAVELRRQGLITVRPGRCGAQITERGIALLGNS